MRTKLLAVLLAASLLLCSCGDGEGSVGGELTAPLDDIVRALQEDNVGLYEAAFPGDFVTGYRAAYSDLGDTLSELLAVARDKNVEDCGENWTLSYEVTSKTTLSSEALPLSCTFDRFGSYVYVLPAEGVDGAAEITVEVCLEGGMDELAFEVVYTVLCIRGIWYLHPMHFGTVMRRN